MPTAPRTRTRDLSVTRIAVGRPPDGGRAVVTLATAGTADRPVLRPMLLSSDEQGARVSLVPDGALLLAGDAIAIEVAVGGGACLELVEPSGTVAYAMDGVSASWSVSIELAPMARLIWAGEPFVVAEGADVVRTADIRLGWGARMAMRETLVLGRHGERPGTLRQSLRVSGSNGVPMLAESLVVGPSSSPLLLGGAKAVGTVTVLGARLAGAAGTRLDLDAAGTVVRRLASDAHEALAAETWADALAQVAQAI